MQKLSRHIRGAAVFSICLIIEPAHNFVGEASGELFESAAQAGVAREHVFAKLRPTGRAGSQPRSPSWWEHDIALVAAPNLLPREARLVFARYTQIGLLRLLTNQAAMGEQTLTLRKAWSVYDRWIEDPRVEFYPEPRGLDAGFREATAPFAGKPASKWVGDCYLLAYAKHSHATLVTLDRALCELAQKQGNAAIIPA